MLNDLTPPNFFLIILIAFGASWALTSWLRRTLLQRAILDIPNERSMHKQPIPRGGGLAVMAVITTGLALTLVTTSPIPSQSWLLLSLFILMLVSWLDDRRGLHPGIRLSAHLLAAFIGTLAFSPIETLFGGTIPFWLDRTITILGWAWFMNLYNFMDGIDGITGTETICIAVSVGLVLTVTGNQNDLTATLIALLIGACSGFLILNQHPAKIFLGDVGSVPLGFLCGYLLLALATQGYLVAALTIPLYYLADSGITFGKRLLRGEKVWQAHRQHFYQRATAAIGPHDRVVSWILWANLALLGAALLAIQWPLPGLFLGIVIVAILLHKMHKSVQS